MNLPLVRKGYPPAIVRPEDRVAYLSSLETAQLGGERDEFYLIIAEAVEQPLNIYLESVG